MASSADFLPLFLSLIVLLTPTCVLSVQHSAENQHLQLLLDGSYPPPQGPASAISPPAKEYSAPPSPTSLTKPPKSPTPSISTPPVPYRPPVKKEECGPLCETRCSQHSRKQVCMRACSTCCLRCKCVPPGTYGNRELCGKCYTDMLTHGDRPKCP